MQPRMGSVLFWVATALCFQMLFTVLVAPASWKVGLLPGYRERLLRLEPALAGFAVLMGTLVRFHDYPSVRFLHILPSSIWAALIPIQLASQTGRLPWARKRHQLLGRIFMGTAISVALGYGSMELHGVGLPPYLIGRLALRAVAAWFVYWAFQAWRTVRRGDIAGHRAAILRHLAGGLWVALQRILVIVSPVLEPLGMARFRTREEKELGFQACSAVAMVLALGSVEVYLLLLRRNRALSSQSAALKRIN